MTKVAIAVVVIAGVAVQIAWAVALFAPVAYLVGAATGYLAGIQ